MPLMTGKTSLAANAKSGNVLANLPFEFVSGRISRVTINIITDVADVLFTMQSGGETLAQNTLVFIDASKNPNDTFKQVLNFLAAPGERLFMEINNGANASVSYWGVRVDPL